MIPPNQPPYPPRYPAFEPVFAPIPLAPMKSRYYSPMVSLLMGSIAVPISMTIFIGMVYLGLNDPGVSFDYWWLLCLVFPVLGLISLTLSVLGIVFGSISMYLKMRNRIENNLKGTLGFIFSALGIILLLMTFASTVVLG
jgi:hypothetical protein